MCKFIMNKNNGLSQLLTALILASIFLFPIDVNANNRTNISFWTSVLTHHVDRTNDIASFEENNVNAFFYNKWLFGHFINSYRRESFILGYQFWHYEIDWPKQDLLLQYGVTIAAATGYGRELATNIDGRVTLGISPYAGVKYWITNDWGIGADLLYLPTDNGGVVVSGLNLTWRF